MDLLQLRPVNAQVCAVHTAAGEHVGYLKHIGTAWKFKAVGHGAQGELEPGGGPLTDRHNRVFDAPDPAVVSARLMGARTPD